MKIISYGLCGKINTLTKITGIAMSLLALLVCLLGSGCHPSHESYDDSASPEIMAANMAKVILEYIKNDETDKICNMFCKKVSSSYDLNGQVSSLTEILNSKDFFYAEPQGYVGEKEVKYGELIIQQLVGYVWDMETSSQENFSFQVYAYNVHDDPDYIGVTYIWLKGSDGTFADVGESP